MPKKLSNEEKYKYAKYRVFCWYMIVFTGILTIVLAILSLTIQLSPVFAIISFILETIFTKLKEKFKEEKE
ncbi:MAG: hypothetical protein HFG40_03515 [Bacilli bacterium]|nr:hypothetical protein [Bacilli bacterium]